MVKIRQLPGRHQRGQMTTEAVLIMLALLGVAGLVATKFREQNLVAEMVEGPWDRLAGMMQNGVWRSQQKGMELHPMRRPITTRGEELK